MMINRRFGRRGFSLIELLIAVTIMLVLAGIAAYFLDDYLHKSKVAKVTQDLDLFASALNTRDALESPIFSNYNYSGSTANTVGYSWFHAFVVQYNASWASFGGASDAWNDYSNNSLKSLLGKYLKTVPVDPWGAPYLLNTSAGYIASMGSDNKTCIGGAIVGITETGREKDIVQYYLGGPIKLVDVIVYDFNANFKIDNNEFIDFVFNKDIQNYVGADANGIIGEFEDSIDLAFTTPVNPPQIQQSVVAAGGTFSGPIRLKDNGRILRFVAEALPSPLEADQVVGRYFRATYDPATFVNVDLRDMDQYFKFVDASNNFGRPYNSGYNAPVVAHFYGY